MPKINSFAPTISKVNKQIVKQLKIICQKKMSLN